MNVSMEKGYKKYGRYAPVNLEVPGADSVAHMTQLE